jgi:protoheme IX farnesyltransferase
MSLTVFQPSLGGTVRDLVSLTKPRVTFLVVATAAGGMWLAPHRSTPSAALVALGAIALVVSSANALNCWMERDSDRHMTRTAKRPLPAGRLDARLALGFGLALGAVAVPALSLFVNPLTGLLGAFALVSYVWIYTPLKQRSWTALLVGAVPGALPPLMGWTAATGKLELPGVLLFGILFVWQVPHFIAIALFRRAEYERAGILVMPSVLGERRAKLHAVLYCAALVPLSLLLVPLGVAGRAYAVVALLIGAVFLGVCIRGLRPDAGAPWARKLFGISLVYLTLLFAALIVDAG